MSAVTWTGQHHEVIIDFSREQYTVPVEGQEWIFQADKCFEILRFSNTDSCAVKICTPDNIKCIFDLNQTWIVSITRLIRVTFFIHKSDRLIINFPI
ncbi:hypothetical protein D3C72_2309330 [compost metagenome]